MILYSTNPNDSEAERAIRRWYETNFGDEDARRIVELVWERERNGPRLVTSLIEMAKEFKRVEARSIPESRQFIGNIIDLAKMPKEVREAELDILAFAKPILERQMAHLQGHRGDPLVKEECLEHFRIRLREKIRSMWPRKHRAAIDGALMAALRDEGGRIVFNARACVKALELNADPLEATAASSHG